MRLPTMFVCLSVSKITQKRVHGFGWNFACRQDCVGTWTNWSTVEPHPDHSPAAGTGKSESRRSVEVGQTGTLLRALRAGYRSRVHCREILFTPRCSPRAREFRGSIDFSVRRRPSVAELRGVKVAQFWILAYFPHTKLLKHQNAKTRFSQKLSNLELWCVLATIGSRTWDFQRTHYWTPKI